ncbi:hypothetical protein J2T12_004319 [Paenibacillus anaericanus]|nr:hypothetical protein [Paenibacillus anaericanus]
MLTMKENYSFRTNNVSLLATLPWQDNEAYIVMMPEMSTLVFYIHRFLKSKGASLLLTRLLLISYDNDNLY